MVAKYDAVFKPIHKSGVAFHQPIASQSDRNERSELLSVNQSAKGDKCLPTNLTYSCLRDFIGGFAIWPINEYRPYSVRQCGSEKAYERKALSIKLHRSAFNRMVGDL